MGITGAVANTAGFISPFLTGIIVEGNVSVLLVIKQFGVVIIIIIIPSNV